MSDPAPIERPTWLTSGDFTEADEPMRLFSFRWHPFALEPKVDYSRGVAITSSWHPDEVTHIEPVRYGRGSNAMGLLATLMTDGGGKVPRPVKFIVQVLKHPILFLRSMSVRR